MPGSGRPAKRPKRMKLDPWSFAEEEEAKMVLLPSAHDTITQLLEKIQQDEVGSDDVLFQLYGRKGMQLWLELFSKASVKKIQGVVDKLCAACVDDLSLLRELSKDDLKQCLGDLHQHGNSVYYAAQLFAAYYDHVETKRHAEKAKAAKAAAAREELLRLKTSGIAAGNRVLARKRKEPSQRDGASPLVHRDAASKSSPFSFVDGAIEIFDDE